MFISTSLLICSCLLLLQSTFACALEPLEVAVIANNRVPESVELAHYYMQQRQIPDNHLILVDASRDETYIGNGNPLYYIDITCPVTICLYACKSLHVCIHTGAYLILCKKN